jgi:hypothetical protein
MSDAESERDKPQGGYVATERIYERQGHRTVLVATEGDTIPLERARELGLIADKAGGRRGKRRERVTDVPPINDPRLTEGLEPIDSPEADLRATGATAEAAARGEIEPAPSPSVTLKGGRPQSPPKKKPRARSREAPETDDDQAPGEAGTPAGEAAHSRDAEMTEAQREQVDDE